MASNYWGIPRTTHDLDFVIQLPASAIDQVVQAFRSDFYLDEAAIRAAYRPPHQFNAIDLRSSLKVDFWLPKAVPFDQEMFARRLEVKFLGERAWMASPEDVILHKLLWNQTTPSERQLGDCAGVWAVPRDRLDVTYLRGWADLLRVRAELEKIISGAVRPKAT
jgi:hypothetical protein